MFFKKEAKMSQVTMVTLGSRIAIAGEGLGLFKGKSLVAAIQDLETTVQMENEGVGISVFFGPPFDTQKPAMDSVGAIVRTLSKRGFSDLSNVRISVQSSIPAGLGLASSSVLLCTLAKCFNEHFKLGITTEDLANIAWDAERIDQGVVCGKFDYYPVLYRGVLLQDFSQNPIRIQRLELPEDTVVVLGMIGISSRYGEVGTMLAKRFAESEPGVLEYRDFMAESVETFVTASQSGDKQSIGVCIGGFHHAIRTMLKIENPPIDALVKEALNAGAYAAKTCGLRFSGGCMFAFTDENSAPMIQSCLENLGARTLKTKILSP